MSDAPTIDLMAALQFLETFLQNRETWRRVQEMEGMVFDPSHYDTYTAVLRSAIGAINTVLVLQDRCPESSALYTADLYEQWFQKRSKSTETTSVDGTLPWEQMKADLEELRYYRKILSLTKY